MTAVELPRTRYAKSGAVSVAYQVFDIAARIVALASPSEVLVSRTVKDLVLGSGLRLESRGTHTLIGVPDRWRLYAVAD